MMNGKRGKRGKGGAAAAAAAPPGLVESVLELVHDLSFVTVSELVDELPELGGGDRDLVASHGGVLCRGLSDDGHAALASLLATGRIKVQRGTVRPGKGV